MKKLLELLYSKYRKGMIANWWETINGPKPKDQ